MKTHEIECRIGKMFEAHSHVVTYHVRAETREEARKKAGNMARRWAKNPNCRVESKAVNVRK